jgi:hypothetical protein
MTTNSLYGCNCDCVPMPETMPSPMGMALNHCADKVDGFFQRLSLAITRPLADLFSFDTAVDGSWIASRLDRPCEDDNQFNARFEETRTRWMSLASAILKGSDLPAANLVELGSRDFVRNQDYRISVSQGMGQVYIDAEITRMHNQKMWY